jgi:hypothetical protein
MHHAAHALFTRARRAQPSWLVDPTRSFTGWLHLFLRAADRWPHMSVASSPLQRVGEDRGDAPAHDLPRQAYKHRIPLSLLTARTCESIYPSFRFCNHWPPLPRSAATHRSPPPWTRTFTDALEFAWGRSYSLGFVGRVGGRNWDKRAQGLWRIPRCQSTSAVHRGQGGTLFDLW